MFLTFSTLYHPESPGVVRFGPVEKPSPANQLLRARRLSRCRGAKRNPSGRRAMGDAIAGTDPAKCLAEVRLGAVRTLIWNPEQTACVRPPFERSHAALLPVILST